MSNSIPNGSKKKTSFLSNRIWGKTLKENFVFIILFSLGRNAIELWGFYKASQWDKFIHTIARGFFVVCIIVLFLCVWVYIRELRTNAKNHQPHSS